MGCCPIAPHYVNNSDSHLHLHNSSGEAVRVRRSVHDRPRHHRWPLRAQPRTWWVLPALQPLGGAAARGVGPSGNGGRVTRLKYWPGAVIRSWGKSTQLRLVPEKAGQTQTLSVETGAPTGWQHPTEQTKNRVITRALVFSRVRYGRSRTWLDRERKRGFGGEGENRTPDLGVMNPSL